MIGIIVASFVLLFGFIIWGVAKFGLLPSYSSYAAKWGEFVNIPGAPLWSTVTVISALLLTPAMVECGEGSTFQFLGFFAPLYLMVVGFTPEYETNAKQKKIHIAGTVICALCATIWMVFVMKMALALLICVVLLWCVALWTKTYSRAMIFWGEMALFLGAYVVTFLSYV